MTDDGFDKWHDDFQKGSPLPSVDPMILKEVWQIARKVRRSGEAAGLSSFGGFYASSSEKDMMSLMYRAMVITTLIDRGVLRDFQDGVEPRDAVFQAAAVLAIDKDDLSEALLHLRLEEISQDEAAQLRIKALAEGHDLDHAQIDARILSALRSAQ